ncbi:hypothetical protein IEO21_07565 [Rhodonia placenta]|uniref:Uncharacterized protein n=1 Tax=Rhodonia placenta TaxID=104341 RepID=A0A8H7U022_9APHY|nr:hypothetical protein IEO21_07565 [Postia placenta]
MSKLTRSTLDLKDTQQGPAAVEGDHLVAGASCSACTPGLDMDSAHGFSQRQNQPGDTSPSSPPGRGRPVQEHALDSNPPSPLSAALLSKRTPRTLSADSYPSAPLLQQAQPDHACAPFGSLIRYTYPIEPPLDSSDPKWLEQMFQQRHTEQRFVGDDILATESIFGDVARELRIAEIQLEQERKLSQVAVKLLGRLAGAQFDVYMNQRVAAGDGNLSEESDIGSNQPRQTRDNDFPHITTPKKRPQEDGNDNGGGSSSDEEGNGGGRKIRRDNKRQRLALKPESAVVSAEEPRDDTKTQ